MGGITVEGVARAFGDVHAVRDASFSVEAGHVAGLIGPNGAGKTTLLLMLATLLAPDAGTIRIAGHDPVAEPRAVRERIGWMPDALGSWPSLTVRDALATSARMYGMTRDAASARAAELIDLVDLAPLADRPTRVLSRGQKQRLSLARALVHDPEVLLLDEPASGLDPAARASLRELVRRLAGEGKTLLVSSHVLAELEEMADTAVYLAGGVTAAADAVERAGRSARQWRVRSLDPLRLGEALTAAGFGDVARIDNLGAVVPLSSEADAAQLLAHLVGVGVPVSSFAPAVGDLEHVFLDLNRAGPPPAASGPDPAARSARPAHEGVPRAACGSSSRSTSSSACAAWPGTCSSACSCCSSRSSRPCSVLATNAWDDGGGGVFSTIVFFVLLLGTLVSPALSGNAINGERDAGTLATTQVTLISTAQLVVGKWVAAWLTALDLPRGLAAVPGLRRRARPGVGGDHRDLGAGARPRARHHRRDRRRPVGPAHPAALLGRR